MHRVGCPLPATAEPTMPPLHCAAMLCRHWCCCCCCVAAELLLLLSLPSLLLLPWLRCAEATAAASHLNHAACSVSAGHASCSGRAVTMYALPPFVRPCACPCWSPRFARLSNIEMDERGGVGDGATRYTCRRSAWTRATCWSVPCHV